MLNCFLFRPVETNSAKYEKESIMNKIYKYIHIYTVKHIKGTSLNSVIVQNSCLSISNFCYFTEYLHYIYYMIMI